MLACHCRASHPRCPACPDVPSALPRCRSSTWLDPPCRIGGGSPEPPASTTALDGLDRRVVDIECLADQPSWLHGQTSPSTDWTGSYDAWLQALGQVPLVGASYEIITAKGLVSIRCMPLTHRRALHISLKTMSLALAGVIHTNLAHAQPLSSTVRRQRAGSARGSMWPCNSILVVASIGHSEMEKKRQFALMPYHGFRGPLYTHSASANEAWAAPLLRYPYLPHSDCRCQKFTHGLAWGKLCRRTAPLLPIRNVCWSAREILYSYVPRRLQGYLSGEPVKLRFSQHGVYR